MCASHATRRCQNSESGTRRFVIDGSNVCLVHGRAHPELRYVLALCNHLRVHGAMYACFFDANMSYTLKEYSREQFEVFQQVTGDPRWSECLHVVPSGTEADEWILRCAKSYGADVISKHSPWRFRCSHPRRNTCSCRLPGCHPSTRSRWPVYRRAAFSDRQRRGGPCSRAPPVLPEARCPGAVYRLSAVKACRRGLLQRDRCFVAPW